jgi:hypothetical protein
MADDKKKASDFPGAHFNEAGDAASFHDGVTAAAFVERFGGEIERVGVAYLVTGVTADATSTRRDKADRAAE